MHISESTYSL